MICGTALAAPPATYDVPLAKSVGGLVTGIMTPFEATLSGLLAALTGLGAGLTGGAQQLVQVPLGLFGNMGSGLGGMTNGLTSNLQQFGQIPSNLLGGMGSAMNGLTGKFQYE